MKNLQSKTTKTRIDETTGKVHLEIIFIDEGGEKYSLLLNFIDNYTDEVSAFRKQIDNACLKAIDLKLRFMKNDAG